MEACQGLVRSSPILMQLLIFLKQPPSVRANDAQTDQEAVEIAVTRLLRKSYYGFVRKNIQASVPKAIMQFMVKNLTLNVP